MGARNRPGFMHPGCAGRGLVGEAVLDRCESQLLLGIRDPCRVAAFLGDVDGLGKVCQSVGVGGTALGNARLAGGPVQEGAVPVVRFTPVCFDALLQDLYDTGKISGGRDLLHQWGEGLFEQCGNIRCLCDDWCSLGRLLDGGLDSFGAGDESLILSFGFGGGAVFGLDLIACGLVGYVSWDALRDLR